MDFIVTLGEAIALELYENVALICSFGGGIFLVWALKKLGLFSTVIAGINYLLKTKAFESNVILTTIADLLNDLYDTNAEEIDDIDTAIDAVAEKITAVFTATTTATTDEITPVIEEKIRPLAKKLIEAKITDDTTAITAQDITAITGLDKTKINAKLKEKGINKTV